MEKRSEKIKLLKLLQAGSISREEFAEKVQGPPVSHVIICKDMKVGPFYVDGKEYINRQELDKFLNSTGSKTNVYLPQKRPGPTLYLPDNGRSLINQ